MTAPRASPIAASPSAAASAGARTRRMKRAYGSPMRASMVSQEILRSGLLELNRGHQLLDVLDFEKSTLVLVVGSPGVRPPALRRLAVAEVEEVLLSLSSMSSASEHCWTLRGWWPGPPAPCVVCPYAVSVNSAAPRIPRSGEVTGDCDERECREAEDGEDREGPRVLRHRRLALEMELAVPHAQVIGRSRREADPLVV